MIEQSVLYIQAIISAYGAWGVFVATIIEEVIAPIPSALAPLAGGFFLLPADQAFALIFLKAIFLVAIPVALGISIGASVVYGLAYFGGKPIVERYRRFLGFSWGDIERIEARITKGRRDEITLFLLRIFPVPGVAVSAFCGAVRYPYTKFLIITLIGTGLRAFGLALIGWQAGEFYIHYLDTIEKFEKQIISVVIIAIVVLGIAYYLWAKKRNARL